MCMINICRGDTLSPTLDTRKCIAPAIVAAGIGAAGSIINGIIGSNSSLSNQRALLREQNEYNTPFAQRSRLLQAGYNPYVMSGAINVGNQQTAGDGNAAAALQAQGIQSGLSQLGNLALMVSQVRKTNAEAAQQEKMNAVTDTKNQLEIQQMKAALEGQNIINASNKYDLDKLKPEQLVKLQKEVENLAADTANKMTQNGVLNLQQDYMVKQIEQLGLSNKQARLLLQYYEPMLQLQLQESKMRVDTGYQNANAASMNALTNSLNGFAQRNLWRSDASINWQESYEQKRTSGYRIGADRFMYKYNKEYYDSPEADWWNSVIPRYIPFAPGAAAVNNSFGGTSRRAVVRGFK